MNENTELVYSPLCTTLIRGDSTIAIQIYRGDSKAEWTLDGVMTESGV
jgi:hypothetical protein